MNRIATLAAFAALSAVTLFVQAQGVAPQQVQIHGLSAQAAEQTAEMRGRYELSDGRTLELSAKGRHLVANLGDAATVTLRAVSGSQYASSDGRLQVQPTQHANGNVSGLVLTEWRGDNVVRTASR